MSQSACISVAVRIRPPPNDAHAKKCRTTRGGEIYREDSTCAWKWDSEKIFFFEPTERGFERGHEYTFSRIFPMSCPTSQLYSTMGKPIVQRTFEGFNGCIFAYGQTNSGKTHTISGTTDSPGIISLAVTDFFNHIRSVEHRVSLLRISFLEVYNEQLKDLLIEGDQQPNLIIQDDPTRGPAVVNLTEHVVSSLQQVLELKHRGEQRRMIGRNNAHEHASRSHTIFQLIFESRGVEEQEVKISTLSIVDLAGSELTTMANDTTDYHSVVEWMKDQQTIAAKAANTSDKRSKQMRPLREREGANIRRSLLALSRVVNTLVRQAQHPNHHEHCPYRDSKLTRILRSALGGNSLTAVIATVNPWMSAYDDKETNATLRFASQVQQIHNHPKQVSVMSEKALLDRYQTELRDLRTQMLVTNATNGEVLTQLKAEKMEMETALHEALHQKSEEGERLQRQFDNLSQFILTSQSSTPVPPTYVEGSRNSSPTYVQSEAGLPDITAPFKRLRRNSFCCIRDPRSLQLFYERPKNQDKLKKYQEWIHDCFLKADDGNMERVHQQVVSQQQQKIKGLERTVADLERELENTKRVLDIKTNLLHEDQVKVADRENYWQTKEHELRRENATLEKKIAEAETAQKEAEKSKQLTETALHDVKQEKYELEKQVMQNSREISGLKDQLNNRDSTIVQLEEKMTELRGTVSGLEQNKSFLQQELDAKGREFATLEKEYHTMMREKIGFEEFHEQKQAQKRYTCMPRKKENARPWIPYIPSEREYFTKYHPTRKPGSASTTTASNGGSVLRPVTNLPQHQASSSASNNQGGTVVF
eukprot:TRINITY_DN59143_c0_g1_i1.p2 TRINITY_DN59143_c0_g1~~TRINITY_DN59143_c0_g1_i1.p2  ORF type:complete len:819 (-),score=89.53 TRINITY_DN59143_c0_g1_i1:2934-5390(-)